MESQPSIIIRPSRDDDVEPMLAIYRRHIRRGIEAGVEDAGTPQPDDLRDRRKNLRNRRLPHLVATRAGEVVGYAYVVQFRKRPAYRFPGTSALARRCRAACCVAPVRSYAIGHRWLAAAASILDADCGSRENRGKKTIRCIVRSPRSRTLRIWRTTGQSGWSHAQSSYHGWNRRSWTMATRI